MTKDRNVQLQADDAATGSVATIVLPEARHEELKLGIAMAARDMPSNPYTGQRMTEDRGSQEFLVGQLALMEHKSLTKGIAVGDAKAQDDGTGMNYLTSQLARIESTMISRYYIPPQYAQLLPTLVGTGLTYDSIRFQTLNHTGVAREISQASDTLPTADVSTGVKDIPVTGMLGIAYQWNVLELAQSASLRKPLDSLRAESARQAFDRALNAIALFGRTESTGDFKFPGLFTRAIDSALTQIALTTAVTGAWGGVSSTSTTAQQILNDVNKALQTVWVATGYNRFPNTVLLPTTTVSPLQQVVSAAGNRSVLDYLKENNIAKIAGGVNVEFIFTPGLEDTSSFDSSTASGNRRLIAYDRDPDAIEFEVTQPLTWLAPQYENFYIRIPGYGRCTRGIKVKRPTNICFMDGI